MKNKVNKFVIELKVELEKKYTIYSILAIDSYSKSYSVSKEGISVIEHDLFTDRGIVIRICEENIWYEYSTNSRSVREIMKELENFVTIRRIRTTTNKYLNRKQVERNEFIANSEKESDEKILSRITNLYNNTLKLDDKILGCGITYLFQNVNKIFVSNEKELIQKYTWANSSISVTAKKKEKITRSTAFEIREYGIDNIDLLEKKACSVAQKAIDLLEAKLINPGYYDCICAPDVSGLIAHEAIGHGVEMDTVNLGQSKAKDWFGKKIGSDIVTLHDNGRIMATGKCYFDDEGNYSEDTIIIKNGILVAGINDTLSANEEHTKYTGNGRRESFERKAYARMTNTYFESGDSSLEEMIKSVKYGLLIEEAQGGMEDPKNWGIQCIANSAREIIDGKLTGIIYSPVIMTGYVPEVLQSVSMISKEVELSPGMCGKGHKEWVEVSDGGPYVKLKMQVG